MIIAIDGPAGTGKSTVSQALASQLKMAYLNTGAFYRMATIAVLNQNIDPRHDPQGASYIVARAHFHVIPDPYQPHYYLDHEEISDQLSHQRITQTVSTVAAITSIRETLTALQRNYGHLQQGIIAEGRDVATSIFPDADMKFFLTATAQARAQRRNQQNIALGHDDNYWQVLADISERDRLDTTREVSPLRHVDDACLIDTTTMTQQEVISCMRRAIDAYRK